jgi:hypothetical protein
LAAVPDYGSVPEEELKGKIKQTVKDVSLKYNDLVALDKIYLAQKQVCFSCAAPKQSPGGRNRRNHAGQCEEDALEPAELGETRDQRGHYESSGQAIREIIVRIGTDNQSPNCRHPSCTGGT